MNPRRLALLAGCGLAGLTAGLAASFLVTPRYHARAVVVVDSEGSGGVTVSSLKSAALSLPLLAAVAEELAPYTSPTGSGPSSRGEEVALLREDIEVRERGGTLEISYTHPVPRTARDVPNRLAAFLIAGAERATPPAEGQPGSVDRELAELKRRMAETAARIDAQRQRAPTRAPLPELRRIQRDLQVLEEEVRTAERLVRDLRGALEARPEAPAAAPTPSPVEELRAELAALRTRYTEEHPDVQRLRARLAEAGELEVPPAPPVAPAADAAVLEAAEVELARLVAERDRVLEALGRAQAAPAPTAGDPDETGSLIREHRQLQERYIALLAAGPQPDPEEAAGASPAGPVRLRTPARWPLEPSSPSRVLFALLGLVGGLALGGVAGALADRYDDRIREPADVEALLRAAQLADIPEIRVARRKGDGHRRARQGS